MIIDGHVHVLKADYGNVPTLLAQLDQAGIDRALCVPGGMIDVRQFSRVMTGRVPVDPTIPNHLVYEAIQEAPERLYGLVCINPLDDAAAIRMARAGFEHGCRGVKLAPIVHRFRFDNPVLEDIALACEEHGFPVYSHVTPQPGSTTTDFAHFARRHPKTNFILGHMGFGPGDADAIEFAAQFPNLYLETSLGNYLILQEALRRLGPGKLVFGSEFPLSHPQVELAKILLLPPETHDAILRQNIWKLLNLPPTD